MADCGNSGSAGVHTQGQRLRMSWARMSFLVFLLGLPLLGKRPMGENIYI